MNFPVRINYNRQIRELTEYLILKLVKALKANCIYKAYSAAFKFFPLFSLHLQLFQSPQYDKILKKKKKLNQ